MSVASHVTEVLEPFVGRTVADTCVRATALSMGKTADTLSTEDLPRLGESVRKLLVPIAPAATIANVMQQIEGFAA